MLQKDIEACLAKIIDPYLGVDFSTANTLKRIVVDDANVMIELSFHYPNQSLQKSLRDQILVELAPYIGSRTCQISFVLDIEPHAGKQGMKSLPQVKNMIAVASGKGGVGKSTMAVNLALALAHEGANVGILDADIYGPSQPAMLGVLNQKPDLHEGGLIPIIRHGIQSMSIGYLIDEHAAMMWRGPMLGKALQQLVHDTKWDNLDYLIIDLPPGTGDVQLTLCQKMPLSGVVMVTTPQDLALLDVRRAVEMFQQLNVPVLGVIENMSIYHCRACHHEEHLFGKGGAQKLAKECNIEILGHVPLALPIREMTDSGEPPVVANPDGPYAKTFYDMACKATAKLSLEPKDYSAKFPKIVIQQSK